MEIDYEKENYLNKCRFCLEPLNFQEEIYMISDFTRRLYRIIVDGELETSEILSKNVCCRCHEDLKYCSRFKEKILGNQMILQEFLAGMKIKPEDPDRVIEVIVEDFVNYESDENSAVYKVPEENPSELPEVPLDTSTIKRAEESTLIIQESKEIPRNIFESVPELKIEVQQPRLKPRKGSRSRAEVLRAIHEKRKQKKSCEMCGKWIAGYRMKMHVSRVHEKIKNFSCDRCGKKFFNKQTIEDHIRAEFGLKTFECQYCGKMLSSNKARLTHIYANHEKKFERFCAICGETFDFKIKYDTHMFSKHSTKKPFECPEFNCQKSFASKSYLNEHRKRLHSNGAKDPCSKSTN